MSVVEHYFVWPRPSGRAEQTALEKYLCDIEPSASPPQDRYRRRDAKIKVLVVFENDYRSYREAIAVTIQALRPEAEVTVAEPSRSETEAKRIAPDLVIAGSLDARDFSSAIAWIQLPQDSERPATVYLDGGFSETANPAVEDLISLFDETEKLVRSRPDRGKGPR